MLNKLKNSTLIRIIIFIFLPIFISVLMYVRTVFSLRSYMEYEVSTNSALLGELASDRLSAHLADLTSVSQYLRDGKIKESDMKPAIEKLLQSSSRTSCGILRLDGTPVCGRKLLESENPVVQQTFRGKQSVRYREGKGFLLTSPIYNGENIKYVLYEFLDVDELFSSFNTGIYNDVSNLILADSDQQIIIPINNDEGIRYDYLSDVQSSLKKVNDKMGANVSAAVYDENESGKRFVFVSELEQDNLYLIGAIPYDVAAGNVASLSILTLLVFILLLVLLIIGTFNLFTANAKAQESDALREAKHIAEEASKAKSTFLANMSHELRTPINVILGMDEMILREASGQQIKERAMDIKSAAQILLGLINDVLDYSKIESGNLTLIPVEYDLTAMIRDLVLLSENRARQKSLNFKMNIDKDLPVGLYGDDIHLRQILINLLTNAVKYTPQGTVTFNLSGEILDEETILLHFEVVDTGIGIKPEDKEKLFIPYSRVEERRNRQVEGTGLGLAIIINLLRLMDTDLKLESVYGEGSKFYFDLKQKIVDSTPIGDVQERMKNMLSDYEYNVSFIAPKARILMVDDNSMNRKLFESLLTETQISVTTASGGQKAIDLVQRERYDIIFLDYLMPEMDGEETLRQLQKLESNLSKNAPVIALTANAFSGAREKYMDMGFDDFLSKPIVPDKLEDMIVHFLPKDYVKQAPAKPAGSDAPKKAPSDVKFPDINGINWDFATIHVNSQMLLSALKDYYNQIDTEYRDILDLFEQIDTEDGLNNYRIRVHALKSTSSMLGILTVSELAKLLEFAAKDGEVSKIRLLNPILLEELLKIKGEMQPEFAGDDTKKEPLTDPSKLFELYFELRASMEEMDIAASDNVMDRIRSYIYEPQLQESIDRLAEEIAALDYDGANEEINCGMDLLVNQSDPAQ